MESMKKLMLVLGLVVLCACATGTTGNDDQGTGQGTGTDTGSTSAAASGGAGGQGGGQGGPCANVRCAACPEGQTPSLRPPNCCECVPVDTSITNCDNVRCAACPTGQHPALTPPDCCRCVPD
jgi:pectate lyase